MKKILISACLAGDRVRYDGRIVPLTDELFCRWKRQGLFEKVCPEVSGGLKIPRPAAQIKNGNGHDVLEGRAKVVDIKGYDLTNYFLKGAEKTCRIIEQYNIKIAILKEKSPSCGIHFIYDGHFDSKLIPGIGVTAAILEQMGIKVFSENELDKVKALLI